MASLSRGKTLDTTGFGLDQSELPPHDEGRLDPRSWFGTPDRPFEIEIGSGKGTFLVQECTRRPDVNVLGIERSGEYYRYAADRIRRHGLSNAKMLRADAVEFIHFWCADGVVDVIHVYFSDPWPKKRHHKRRVVQDASLRAFHRVLRPGGRVRLVTDHAELWAWYEEHAARHADLYERHAYEPPPSAGAGEVVGTNYERKFVLEGRAFRGMELVRN